MRHLGKKMILAFGGLLIVLGCAALFLRPDWRYLAVNAMSRSAVRISLSQVEEGAFAMKGYTMEQLLAEGGEQDRSLMLINSRNHIPEDFQPRLIDYNAAGVLMDEAMEEDYEALSQAVQEQFGVSLLIRSSYRTREAQEEPITEDGDVAATLDASEHQAGLALDVYVPGYAGRALLKTEAGQWINDNCWQYGFIIRYPYYGVSETGIPYEPWHLRYVGRPHAELMTQNSWTMETYFEELTPGRLWQYENYVITRQADEPFTLPADWTSVTVSPDNQGGYVFTVTLTE